MIDTREMMLLNKIHSLVSQLEDLYTEKGIQKPTKEWVDNQKINMLLKMACDCYWLYDPTTNMVEISFLNSSNQDKKIVRSLSALLRNITIIERKIIDEIILKLTLQKSEEERFSYRSEHQGQIIDYEVVARYIDDDDGVKLIGVANMLAFHDDQDMRYIKEQQKFKLLLSISNMFIWEYDVADQLFTVNESLCKKLSLKDKEYKFDEFKELLKIPELDQFQDGIRNKNLSGHAIFRLKSSDYDYDLIFESNYQYIKDKHDNYVMLLGTIIDITEKELLKTNASKDALTGCFNRRSADITLVNSFQKFIETGEFYTLIFFDIDKFKQVNDRYGHDMGDYVLKHICEIINKEIRVSDMFFRWGGDEFLLICTGISKENIYAYIERLRRIVEASKFEFNKIKLDITISVGAAYYYKSDNDFQIAMKRANRSVYKSKLAGRNKVCILK